MKKFIALVLVLFAMQNIFAQSGWQQIYSPTNQTINSASFLNSTTGFICVDNGKIYKTDNSGNNWVEIVYRDSNNAIGSRIQFIGNHTGFILTNVPNKFYKTTDGGNSWLKFEYLFNNKIRDMSFVNTDTGFVLAGNRVFKTINSGVSWDTLGLIYYPSFQFTQYGIYFINSQTGFVVTGAGNSFVTFGQIWKTTNCGLNWNLKIDFVQYSELTQIFFLNESTGFASGAYGTVYKTTDAGETWLPRTIQNYNPNIISLEAVSENKIFACGRWGFYKSENGGQSWSVIPVQNGLYCKIEFTSENTGYLFGASGLIFKTTNGGGVFVSQISSEIPEQFLLKQNYPNPYNPSTRINYELRNSNYVTLKVFDLLGKEVAVLVNEKQNAGSYAVDFNSSEFNLPSGIYFYTLNAEEFKETKKMVLVK